MWCAKRDGNQPTRLLSRLSVAHPTRLHAQVKLYTADEPDGVVVPTLGTRTDRGGTLEAFVSETAAFAAAVRGEDSDDALPHPAYSLGEVCIAAALYRSAASGAAEAVGVPPAAESPEPAERPPTASTEPEASVRAATGRGTDLFELFDKGARAEAS